MAAHNQRKNRTGLGATANFTNSATIGVVKDDTQVIVQTPINVVTNNTLKINGESHYIQKLLLTNQARIERVRGMSNVIIQIPILIIDEIDLTQLENYEIKLNMTTLLNDATAASIEGDGNVVIQIPVLIVGDISLGVANHMGTSGREGSGHAKIKNVARNNIIEGGTNIIIQTPVQFTANIQHLIKTSRSSTTLFPLD